MEERKDIERDETDEGSKGQPVDVEQDETQGSMPESPPPVATVEEIVPQTNGHLIPPLSNVPRRESFVNGKNGRTSRRGRKVAPARSNTGKVLLIIIAFALIASACMPLIMPIKTSSGPVDGDFSKWSSANLFEDTYGKYALMEKESLLLTYFEAKAPLFQSPQTIWALIDADGDSKTGYAFKDIGGEYLYEIFGENGTIASSSVFKFDSSKRKTDWNGFESIGSLPSANSGSKVEMGFGIPSGINTKAYFILVDFNVVVHSQAYIPMSKKSVLISTVEPFASVVSNDTTMLKLHMSAMGTDSVVRSITFSGNGISKVALYDGGSKAAEISAPGKAAFTSPLTIPKGSARTLDVEATVEPGTPSGGTVELSVADMQTDSSLSVQGAQRASAYAYAKSTEHSVDGLFGEWTSSNSDSQNDVKDPGGKNVSDPAGDITAFSSHDQGSTSFHYLKVNGTVALGALIPGMSAKMRPPKGPVQVNITLPKEELTGEDRIYVLLDADSNVNTGYAPGTIGADKGVLTTGRDGSVLSSTALSYTGNGSDWKWGAISGMVASAVSGSELEVMVDLTGASYFYVQRWNGNSDAASAFRLLGPLADPYIVEGFVTDENGAKIPGLLVQVCDDRTGKCLTTTTGVGGYYQVDFAELEQGYQNGDGITVTATNMSSGKQGTGTGSVDVSQGGSRIDVTIPELKDGAIVVLSGWMLLSFALGPRRRKGKD